MLVLFIQSTRKSALLSAAKKAKLKNNPSRVRFAEGVVINGTTLPLVCFLRTAMFTYLMTVEAFLDFKNKSFRFYFSFRFCWLNAAIFIRETMRFFSIAGFHSAGDPFYRVSYEIVLVGLSVTFVVFQSLLFSNYLYRKKCRYNKLRFTIIE